MKQDELAGICPVRLIHSLERTSLTEMGFFFFNSAGNSEDLY